MRTGRGLRRLEDNWGSHVWGPVDCRRRRHLGKGRRYQGHACRVHRGNSCPPSLHRLLHLQRHLLLPPVVGSDPQVLKGLFLDVVAV